MSGAKTGSEENMQSARRSVQRASELTGVFPALFTPLADDDPSRLRNSIDHAKARTMIDDLIAIGVTGLVPVGTTGQSPTVSHAQHIEFIKFVVDYVDGRVPVIAGAGSNCTRESVEMIQAIERACGSLACLCVTGYYNNPPQEGLIRHYETLAAETGQRLIIYNVPGRTSSYLEPETLLRLAEHPSIIGLKQAVDFRSPGPMRDATARVCGGVDPDDFAVLSGEDDGLFAILDLGGRGIVSASANIPEVARAFLECVEAWESGEKERARQMQDSVLPLVEAVFLHKNPIPLGTFLNSPLYLPLVDLAEVSGGAEAVKRIQTLILEAAPSLKKYHPDLER